MSSSKYTELPGTVISVRKVSCIPKFTDILPVRLEKLRLFYNLHTYSACDFLFESASETCETEAVVDVDTHPLSQYKLHISWMTQPNHYFQD